MTRALWTPAIILALLAATSCGYRLVGRENRSGVASVAIPLFLNQTAKAGLENLVTTSLRQKFIASKKLPVLSQDRAEAVLEGYITGFSELPVSFTPDGFTLEARATVEVQAKLTKKVDGKAVWQVSRLAYSDEYRADADIPTNEKRRQEALKRIARELAEQMYHGILSQF